MTDEQIISSLKENFGTELTTADIKGFCAAKNLSYPTVTRHLEQFKINRGRWNLEVTSETVENLENTFNSPSVLGIGIIEAVKQNLVPDKDATFVKFGNFTDIKKIIPKYIINQSTLNYLLFLLLSQQYISFSYPSYPIHEFPIQTPLSHPGIYELSYNKQIQIIHHIFQ